MKQISVIVPLYHEEAVVEKFYTALKKELVQLQNYTHSILFVVDGDGDNTVNILRQISEHDSSVEVVVFSRNFGHQMALLAGIDHAQGDAIIMMDGDLQHPPSLIPKLLEQFEKRNDVVHAVRESTEDIGFRRKFASQIFYRLVNIISDTPIIEGAADFRLISRRVADIMHKNIRERNLFIRGIVNWIGFKQATVPYIAAKRAGGKSKYSLIKLVRFAFSGAISFGRRPLRIASFVGSLFAIGGFVFALWTLVQYYLGNQFPAGWATVVMLLSIFGGLQLIFLGIVGEYVGAIFDEVKARPHYLVQEKINL
ncbi:MAG: glycosyltransferase family 2 protein [Candidatus Magasanikbacteria bacterium]|nr:glycosyltransferase family 2 protein [Candidatus Magasanikbacteria bacterium]